MINRNNIKITIIIVTFIIIIIIVVIIIVIVYYYYAKPMKLLTDFWPIIIITITFLMLFLQDSSF